MAPKCPTALTAWTRSVSGSISLPSPGCFSPFPHGTVRYRSRPVGSLGPWSAQLPTRLSRGRVVLELGQQREHCLAYGTLTRYGTAFQPFRSKAVTLHCARDAALTVPARNPRTATPAAWHGSWFRRVPFRSPLLRELFFFLGVHEMFQFPRLPPTLKVGSSAGRPGWGCPIRR